MTTHLIRGPVDGALSALVAGFFAFTVLPVPSAHAQGLFQAIFGSLTGNPGRAYAPVNRDDRYPNAYGGSGGGERPMGEARGSGTLCVRLCDGRHFPLPRSANGVALNANKVCSSLCPAAKTQVFQGSKPDYAVASNGARYADLENAFVYRDKIVPDCSCTGNGPGGLAQIDVESDPTLRAGDVVATAGGMTVFKGSGSFPYKTADFTPIDSYGRANWDLRRHLSTLKVDPTATPATAIQSLATADEEKPAAKPRKRMRAQAARDDNGQPPWAGWFR